MFTTNERYITCGVQENIPVEIQAYIWNLIDIQVQQKKPLDYLQVFTITSTREANGKLQLRIKHSQEQPAYSHTHKLNIQLEEPITAKLFCICDGTHSTLLLANEY